MLASAALMLARPLSICCGKHRNKTACLAAAAAVAVLIAGTYMLRREIVTSHTRHTSTAYKLLLPLQTVKNYSNDAIDVALNLTEPPTSLSSAVKSYTPTAGRCKKVKLCAGLQAHIRDAGAFAVRANYFNFSLETLAGRGVCLASQMTFDRFKVLRQLVTHWAGGRVRGVMLLIDPPRHTFFHGRQQGGGQGGGGQCPHPGI